MVATVPVDSYARMEIPCFASLMQLQFFRALRIFSKLAYFIHGLPQSSYMCIPLTYSIGLKPLLAMKATCQTRHIEAFQQTFPTISVVLCCH